MTRRADVGYWWQAIKTGFVIIGVLIFDLVQEVYENCLKILKKS